MKAEVPSHQTRQQRFQEIRQRATEDSLSESISETPFLDLSEAERSELFHFAHQTWLDVFDRQAFAAAIEKSEAGQTILNGEPLEDREKSILDELKVPAVVAGAGFAGGAVTSAGIDAYMKKPIDRRTMVKTGLFTGFIAGVVGLATKFGLNPSGSSEFMDKHPMRCLCTNQSEIWIIFLRQMSIIKRQ